MQDTDPTLSRAADRFARAASALSTATWLRDDDVPPELAELLELLAGQAEWRVLVDGTKNFGHQASTVALLRRLIELTEYAGRVVVVYIDHGRALLGCTADKLALMFAGVDPTRMDDAVAVHGTCRNIRFMPFARRAELREMAVFGFTGGADEMAVNFARELSVRFFARVQPYLWDDLPSARDDPYYECSRIEQPDGRHLYLLEAYPALQHLPIKLPYPSWEVESAAWRWYAEEQTFDDDLACRARNVRAVLSVRINGAARHGNAPWLWPVYGLQHFKDRTAEMMLTCALAAFDCVRITKRSIVLCSFSPHQELEGWGALVEALAVDLASQDRDLPSLRIALSGRVASTVGEGSLSGDRLLAWTRALGGWIYGSHVPVRVRVHRAYDTRIGRWTDIGPTLGAALRDGASPEVHVVELGPVPMDVFHHCLAHADLSPVIEGQAAANLLTGLGRPFLQVLREEHVIKNGYASPAAVDDAVAMAETAGRTAQLIHDLLPRRWVVEHSTENTGGYCVGIERIVKFMLGAQDKSTEIAVYFERIGRHYAQNHNDKLLMALLALKEVMFAKPNTAQG